MKFVYCGYDFMLDCARTLQADGHELGGILTFPCDNVFNFNRETIALANASNLPALIEKPKPEHIDYLFDEGCDCFIAAGYLYKIPNVAPAYGLNVHPALLPQARGLMPLPHIIIDRPEAAGFTIHKLADDLDTGDILYQEAFTLSPDETVETLSDRIAREAPKALSKIMADLPRYWNAAQPQNESKAITLAAPDDKMRFLDWSLPLEQLDKIARAFGHFGSLAQFDNAIWVVHAHEIRKENHDRTPGTVVARQETMATIAAKGGFFIVKKFDKANVVI